MATGRLRVKLKSYDHRVLDEAVNKIIDTALATGAKIIGPIPLPTKRSLMAIKESPFTDKDAQEHYEVLVHKRLIDILDPSPAQLIPSAIWISRQESPLRLRCKQHFTPSSKDQIIYI